MATPVGQAAAWLAGPSPTLASSAADIARQALGTGGGILGSNSRSDGRQSSTFVMSSPFVIGDNAAVGEPASATRAVGGGGAPLQASLGSGIGIATAIAAALALISIVRK
jgi:hypothetical protein